MKRGLFQRRVSACWSLLKPGKNRCQRARDRCWAMDSMPHESGRDVDEYLPVDEVQGRYIHFVEGSHAGLRRGTTTSSSAADQAGSWGVHQGPHSACNLTGCGYCDTVRSLVGLHENSGLLTSNVVDIRYAKHCQGHCHISDDRVCCQ